VLIDTFMIHLYYSMLLITEKSDDKLPHSTQGNIKVLTIHTEKNFSDAQFLLVPCLKYCL